MEKPITKRQCSRCMQYFPKDEMHLDELDLMKVVCDNCQQDIHPEFFNEYEVFLPRVVVKVGKWISDPVEAGRVAIEHVQAKHKIVPLYAKQVRNSTGRRTLDKVDQRS